MIKTEIIEKAELTYLKVDVAYFWKTKFKFKTKKKI
jgi:hypothetical protein